MQTGIIWPMPMANVMLIHPIRQTHTICASEPFTRLEVYVYIYIYGVCTLHTSLYGVCGEQTSIASTDRRMSGRECNGLLGMSQNRENRLCYELIDWTGFSMRIDGFDG